MNKRERVFSITKGRCYYCGCKLDINNYHIDHFVSRIEGGKGGDNLVPSCADCNLSKSGLSIEEFRQEIANYLTDNLRGRMINKFYKPKQKPIEFYFEKKGLR